MRYASKNTTELILTYILQHFVTLVDDEVTDSLQVQGPILCKLHAHQGNQNVLDWFDNIIRCRPALLKI